MVYPVNTPNGVLLFYPKWRKMSVMQDPVSIGNLVKEKRESLGMSQEFLAERIGASQATIDKIEHGRSRKSKFLTDVFIALELPLDKLPLPVREVEKMIPVAPRPSQHPGMTAVYGTAEGGNGNIQLTTDPAGYIQTPHPLLNVVGGYAVVVSGESMVPRFRPGELALVHPHMTPRPGHDVILYSDDEEDGETLVIIKTLAKMKPHHWVVEQYNPAKTYELSKAEWNRCHVVVGTYGKW